VEALNIAAAFEGLGAVEFRHLASFNQGHVGAFWAANGDSPWERHPYDDELLLVVDGSVDIEVLDDRRSETTTVEAGCLFVVPRGRWHRHRHTGLVRELYLTPGPSEMSFAEDPRRS
jgi:mannose-6-phosphate isomerase-like protein (cupin superfamily)